MNEEVKRQEKEWAMQSLLRTSRKFLSLWHEEKRQAIVRSSTSRKEETQDLAEIDAIFIKYHNRVNAAEKTLEK